MPGRTRVVTFGILVLLAIASLGGCQRTGKKWGAEGGPISWHSSATNLVPGIDEGQVTFFTLWAGPEEGVRFAVWSDLANSSGNSQKAGSAFGAQCEGHHAGTGGRQVEFRARTTDGKSGSATIAGAEYDLAKGSLFLVSTSANPPTVAQIAFDLSKFPKEAKAIQELAKSTPEIRDFFEARKKMDGRTK